MISMEKMKVLQTVNLIIIIVIIMEKVEMNLKMVFNGIVRQENPL